jgi:hypothetical protein
MGPIRKDVQFALDDGRLVQWIFPFPVQESSKCVHCPRKLESARHSDLPEMCLLHALSELGREVLHEAVRRRQRFLQTRVVSVSTWTSGFENRYWSSPLNDLVARSAYERVPSLARNDAAKEIPRVDVVR